MTTTRTIRRTGRLQKAIALVPLAVLSGAWTASLAGVGAGAAPVAASELALPDGTIVPANPIEAAASVSSPDHVAPAVPAGTAQQVVATASASGIPSAALAAYQRAEAVINAADPACQIPWQLIAAIGRVESDHGRTGGNSLDDAGVATPGIYGIALDGKKGTQLIRDTDAGQYDADATYDRAVGPMQFIPSTWSVVGVDADGDGMRNPQDINDSALASAVYLCSGNGSLDSVTGQQSAVYRYNHSTSYVNLVLGIMRSYLSGDYSAVPNATTSAAYFPSATVKPTRHHTTKHHGSAHQGSTGSGSTPTTQPVSQPSQPTSSPTQSPSAQPTKHNVVKGVTQDPAGTVTNTVKDPVGTVKDTLTLAQAIVACTTSAGLDNPLSSTDPYDVCMHGYGF
jgi:membrane-bound lytic murein transglycosylase B